MDRKENTKDTESIRATLDYRMKRINDFVARYDEQQAWDKIQKRIRHRKQMRIYAYCSGAAASILLAVFIGFSLSNPIEDTNSLFAHRGEQNAILVTEDGTHYNLLQNKEQIFDNAGQQVAQNTMDELRYDTTPQETTETAKHILQVPRGGEYKIILSDGTFVHTNSESRITYPVSFSGDKREVYLVGEAYFEVAKDPLHPFIVHTPCGTIEVMGTQFNVNTYTKDQTVVTLKEGSVKVCSDNSIIDAESLIPGQQAIIQPQVIQTKQVQIQEFTSWTDGIYEYSNTPLEDIVEQLSRWYDVDITFKNKQLRNRIFTGVIFRDQPLQQAVDILSKVSNVKFVQKNNCIVISEKRFE